MLVQAIHPRNAENRFSFEVDGGQSEGKCDLVTLLVQLTDGNEIHLEIRNEFGIS